MLNQTDMMIMLNQTNMIMLNQTDMMIMLNQTNMIMLNQTDMWYDDTVIANLKSPVYSTLPK